MRRSISQKWERVFDVGEVNAETPELVAKLFKWTTTESHSAYFKVPPDFDQYDYDMSRALADHDGDAFTGLERDLDEVVDDVTPPGGADSVPVLNLEGFKL